MDAKVTVFAPFGMVKRDTLGGGVSSGVSSNDGDWCSSHSKYEIERVSFHSDLFNRLVQFWASATLLGVERSGPSFVLVWQARSERKRRNYDVAQPLWSTWGEYRRYSE